jgi:23S rRNA pseudouridine2457 synthase
MDKYQSYLIYKPYMVLSQFTKETAEDVTLADLGLKLPKDCYSIGRLDKDSEGLLILTNDNSLKQKLADPSNDKQKIYYVQIEGEITEMALNQLRNGVTISINGKDYQTRRAKAKKIEEPNMIPPRNPPIRHRANIPTEWISISVSEGKNRQIRKMCAKVGFPVLRLVRHSMGPYHLGMMNGQKIIRLPKVAEG